MKIKNVRNFLVLMVLAQSGIFNIAAQDPLFTRFPAVFGGIEVGAG